jgi:hypothetical protein
MNPCSVAMGLDVSGTRSGVGSAALAPDDKQTTRTAAAAPTQVKVRIVEVTTSELPRISFKHECPPIVADAALPDRGCRRTDLAVYALSAYTRRKKNRRSVTSATSWF